MVEPARLSARVKLPALPCACESVPLLLPIGGGKPRSMTPGGIYEILKQVFVMTSERLRQRRSEFAPRAGQILQAFADWLRHTACTHLANNDVDLRHVRDNLVH